MLFFNDEGTENGGLIYNGHRKPDGTVSSGLSLTFDRYQQDQQLQLLGVDQGGRSFAGLMFNDVADGVQRPVLSEQDKAAKPQATTPSPHGFSWASQAARTRPWYSMTAKANRASS